MAAMHRSLPVPTETRSLPFPSLIAQILHILLGRDALYLLERALQDGAVGEAAVLGHGIVPPVGMGGDDALGLFHAQLG